MKRIHDEDVIFIENVKRHRAEDPKVADVAGNLIRLKKYGEQLGVLDTKKFSGFGKPRINIVDDRRASDPAYKLRQLAMQHNKRYEKQRGGLLPIAIPILASISGAIAGRLFDLVKEKLQGKGFKVPKYKTHKHKKQFLIQLAKHI